MSKSPRGGLGRGLESLIRTSAQSAQVVTPTDLVAPPEGQPPQAPRPATPTPPPAAGAAPSEAAPHASAGAEAVAAERVAEANPVEALPAEAGPVGKISPETLSAAARPPQTTPAEGLPALPRKDSKAPSGPTATNASSPLEVFWGPDPRQPPASPESAGPGAPGQPEFRNLAVDDVHANARQPRTVFDDDALAELAYSIRAFGVLQPIVVRPDPTRPGSYELVMGERRLRAARAAGLETIPAVIRHTADDAMLRDALLENLHRAQLNPLEEAAAYQQLLEEFGVTHDELATRIGRSRSQVSNTVRLMNLSLPVQRRVAAGVLSAGHARALLALADADTQDDLATRIVAEGLSVRATEELVSLTTKGLVGASRHRPTRRLVASDDLAATELAERLSDWFDTTVRVDIGRRKGKVTIEFASVDDLERIVAVMAPELAIARHPGEASAAG